MNIGLANSVLPNAFAPAIPALNAALNPLARALVSILLRLPLKV